MRAENIGGRKHFKSRSSNSPQGGNRLQAFSAPFSDLTLTLDFDAALY